MPNIQGFENLQKNDNIDLMEVISYGFSAVFKKWKLWIIGSFLLFFISGALSGLSTINGANNSNIQVFLQMLMILISFLITPAIISLALQQHDNDTVKISEIKNTIDYPKCLKTNGIIYIMGMIITGIFSLIGSLTFLSPLMDNTNFNNDQITTALIWCIICAGILIIISIFISPLISFSLWIAADKDLDLNVQESFITAYNIGKNHYTTIVLWIFTFIIFSIITSILTFGIALIIIVPAIYLSQAKLYDELLTIEGYRS